VLPCKHFISVMYRRIYPVIFTAWNRYSPLSSANMWSFLNHRIMHRFLMGRNRKPDDEPTTNSCLLVYRNRNRTSTYNEAYLSFGFTSVTILNSDERPQCVLCLSSSAADSIKPNKLKQHLETKHSEMGEWGTENTSIEDLM
jgi:hypothetical protein